MSKNHNNYDQYAALYGDKECIGSLEQGRIYTVAKTVSGQGLSIAVRPNVKCDHEMTVSHSAFYIFVVKENLTHLN